MISSEGMRFTEEKLQKVLNLPKPRVASEMKQFLGVVNYFRNHLKGLAAIVQPLQEMIKNYKKGSKLVLQWTTEAEVSYDRVMDLLRNCPMLYFLDDVSPIHLYTDASNRGFGAYLCQIVDGIERPISFLSKSVAGSQKNWHTVRRKL